MRAIVKRFVPTPVRNGIRAVKNSIEKVNSLALNWPRGALFIPYRVDSDSYTLPAYVKSIVPPRNLWVNYGVTEADYLETGERDVRSMRQILKQADLPIEMTERILEIGCAAGRMVRHLKDLAPSHEIWGVDLWAAAVMWCQENLSPPFHFATTTAVPHLPFKDEYFDLIYAGSVFTHIDELTSAWFLELRRVLRPNGGLCFSLNDRRAVRVFEGERSAAEFAYYCTRVGGQESWEQFVDGWFRQHPAYHSFVRKEADMVVLGRPGEAHVLWDAEVLCKRLEPFWRVLSINEKAYGHQTVILLQKAS
jgi:SAM-dependent methyltransferase